MKRSLKGTTLKVLSSALVMVMLATSTSFAGQWKQENAAWKYQNDNGSYVTGWNWIDGKSYYFDSNGKMLANTTTPDGYTVNADGAWVVNGVVQTQNANASVTTNASNYDPQYPLKGYIESWFSIDPYFNRTSWKSDPYNFINAKEGSFQYVLNLAIQNKDPLSLNFFRGRDLAAIAKLADYPTIGLEGHTPEEVEALAVEIRNFLNSFDWRNASDYEKAVRIAKRITKADYLSEEGTQFADSCLIDGKANCSGYTNAANLLATCVGLPTNGLGGGNHIYPTFLVDGMWLAYEPTSKDDYFTIANVYAPSYYMDGEPQLTQLGEYCRETGYEIPTSVEGKFPNISYGIIYGEQAPFIKFK